MARHKAIDTSPRFLAVDLEKQLLPVVRATQAHATQETLYTADAGYHSEANLKALAEEQINALIADNGMRQRDERFKDRGKHTQKPDPLYDKAHPKKTAKRYRPQDFTLDPAPVFAPVQRANRSTAMARTASTTGASPRNTAAPCAIACPAHNAPNASARQRRPRFGKSPSFPARPIDPKKATPTG